MGSVARFGRFQLATVPAGGRFRFIDDSWAVPVRGQFVGGSGLQTVRGRFRFAMVPVRKRFRLTPGSGARC